MRQNNPWLRLPVLVLLAVVIWTGWIYERLPQIMVTHWGFWGQPNGWMDKLTGAWLIPGIMMLLWALWETLPAADKRHCQSRAFLTPYWSMGGATLLLLAGLQWGVAQFNFNPEFPLIRFMGWLMVLFVAWLGRILPEVPLNLIMGIRTRWSLADGYVWRLAHRETAKGLRTIALMGIIFQVALPSPWNLVFVLVSFVGCLIWGAVISYLHRT